MVGEPEGPIGLPQAPPPRPAARQRAIDAALRKFDGLEPAAPISDVTRQPSRFGWAMRHQRAAGAVATAVLVLSLSVPIALRTIEEGRPTAVTPEVSSPAQPAEALPAGSLSSTPSFVAPPTSMHEERKQPEQNEAKTAAPRPLPGPLGRTRGDAVASEDVADQGAPTALAPPPPPPPPPPPAPPPPSPAPSPSPIASVQTAENHTEFADKTGLGEVVVTGSRVRRPSTERLAVQSSPVAMLDARERLLAELQGALGSGDRERVLQLVRLPLRVRYVGGAVTYRRAADVRRDFDRIFTPAVETSLLKKSNAQDDLRPGRTQAVGRVTLSRRCSNDPCEPTSSWRIVAVTP